MVRVFVSYRREDSAYVAATINEKLREHFGRESVYFDIDAIPLGVDFRRHISEAVGSCDVLIVVIGDAWTSSADDEGRRRIDNPVDPVRLEIEAALARNIPVVPVLVGNARMPAPADLPSAIQDLAFRNAAEVRSGRDLQQHLAFLITGLKALVKKPDQQRPAQNATPDTDVRKSLELATRNLTERSNRTGANRRQRRNICALVLLSFVVVGCVAGSVTSGAAGNDGAGITLMIAIWLFGSVIVLRAWRRWPRT